MPSPCDCCDGRCQYCTSMGYTWPKITRITGQSKNNVRKHMLLHPCCKKTSKAAVQHPLLNRPLIVDALPLELQSRILLQFGDNLPLTHPFPRPVESLFEEQNVNVMQQDEEQVDDIPYDDGIAIPPQNLDVNMDDFNGADYLIANEAIEVHPVIPMPPPISPEVILRLQAQADESMRLQASLNVALQSVEDITAEKNAISNDKAETERLLQETQLSLQTQTEENAILVQQQDELNQRLQALTTERDAALYRNDDDSRLLSETRELLQAEIQLKEELTQQLDIATSRELKVTLERDSAIVRENSLEAQLGPLREQIIKLSNQKQEKNKLLRDLDAERRRDVDIAKNASKLEAEKQIQAALNKEYLEFGGQVLQCLQNLSLSSDELKEDFSQACAEKYAEGCYLVDLFGILQQLIDHIYAHHGEEMVSVERELKEKAIKAQDLGKTNEALSTKLENVILSAGHLKSSSDSLQVKLDTALRQLAEKDSQVESLRSDSSVLETSLAEKTQLYETTITELRSELQKMCQENQDIARQLMEKEQDLITLANELTQSKQEFTDTLDERNRVLNSYEEQISTKDLSISQLTVIVHQREESLRGTKADLNQKLARITELEFTYQQQQAITEDSRRQVLELTAQVQSNDTTIESLKERVLMLEAKSKTDAVELENLTNHYEIQLTQANSRISGLVCQLNVLSNNSVNLQSKLDDAAEEKLAVVTQLKVSNQERDELQSQALESTSLLLLRERTITQLTTDFGKSVSILQARNDLVANLESALNGSTILILGLETTIKEKNVEIDTLKSMLDARDAMVKPHEPKDDTSSDGLGSTDMDSSSSTSSEESLPIQRKRMKVDESDADSSECSEFIEDGERMEEDENSDPESDEGGAEVSFVSNGSTLIGQSPARLAGPKKCISCKGLEGTRKKSGEVVVFNVNPRNQKKYAKCRSCMKNNDETNAKALQTYHQTSAALKNGEITKEEALNRSKIFKGKVQMKEDVQAGRKCHSPRCSKSTIEKFCIYNDFKYCSMKCLNWYLEENKNETLRYQEKARLENDNKPKPAKPILLQLEEKANYLLNLVSADYRSVFEDPTHHLVFVDTENDGKKWTLNKCRELSFYSAKLDRWLFYDVDMDGNHLDQMQDCFKQLLELFPEPVVFVHFNYTENKLLKELFGRFEDLAPSHSYCDLLALARALIDTKNPASHRLYCPTRNLAIILKYWYEGTDSQYNIIRQMEIMATTGRKSELDVCHAYHFYSGIKKCLFK